MLNTATDSGKGSFSREERIVQGVVQQLEADIALVNCVFGRDWRTHLFVHGGVTTGISEAGLGVSAELHSQAKIRLAERHVQLGNTLTSGIIYAHGVAGILGTRQQKPLKAIIDRLVPLGSYERLRAKLRSGLPFTSKLIQLGHSHRCRKIKAGITVKIVFIVQTK